MQTVNFYKIISANTDMVYVGSTVKPLEERLRLHVVDYKRFQEDKHYYITSYEILEKKDYSIQLIETLECENRKDRDTRECYHIINTPNTVNKVMPGRTRAQHYQDNKEQILEEKKQYYQNNKERIQQYKKQKHNCNCGGKYITTTKTQHERTNKHQTFITNNQPINNHANVINVHIYNNAPQQ